MLNVGLAGPPVAIRLVFSLSKMLASQPIQFIVSLMDIVPLGSFIQAKQQQLKVLLVNQTFLVLASGAALLGQRLMRCTPH